MSASPPREDPAEEKKDELEDTGGEPETGEPEAPAEPSSSVPVKRGRGRPRGSKNKKTLAAQAVAGGSSNAGTSSDPPVKRPRGRPPKRRADGDAPSEPTAKRPRGRPPKNKPAEVPAEKEGGDGDGEGVAEAATTSTQPPKKKRGRPPKNATS